MIPGLAPSYPSLLWRWRVAVAISGALWALILWAVL